MATTAQLGILVLLLLACTAVANVPDLGGKSAATRSRSVSPEDLQVHAFFFLTLATIRVQGLVR